MKEPNKPYNSLKEKHQELLNTIGEKVRLYRLENGITQEKLAEFCQITPEAISRIEHGKMNLSMTVLAEIAENLDHSVADLLATPDKEWAKKHAITKLYKLLENQDERSLKLIYNISEKIIGYKCG